MVKLRLRFALATSLALFSAILWLSPPMAANEAIDVLELAESPIVQLKYRSYRTWKIQLPAEKWFPVHDGISLAGRKFPVAFDGNDLQFDTDGDGELDRTIKPLIDPKTLVSTTRVVLEDEQDPANPFRYAIRLRNDAQGWEWAPGGALAGTIQTQHGPIPVRVIDRDGNGRHGDIGSDAMIVGNTDYATLLSETIVVGNHLASVKYGETEESLELGLYQGATAEVDLTSDFQSKSVLLSTVILSDDKKHSFDAGALRGKVRVPAGTYRIAAGQIGLGDQRATILPGRSKPLKLTAGSLLQLEWGGPIQPEFKYQRSGNQVQFAPAQIWYFGRAGEQYTGWTPAGKSPEFKILNADTGAVLEVAILPGSC